MKVGILVNDAGALEERQTTTMLAAEAAARGWRVLVFGVADLELHPGRRVRAWARALGVDHAAPAAAVAQLAGTRPTRADLSHLDLLLVRTNPARDLEREVLHRTALSVAVLLANQGVKVVNDPQALAACRGKLFLEDLPQRLVVQGVITGCLEGVMEALRRIDGPAVLKPLEGTWGQGVTRLESGDSETATRVARELLAKGFVIVQEFLPEAVAGDVRVVVVDGSILEVDGKLAAVRRVPGAGDFRSNIHAGGSPAPALLSEEQRATSVELAAILGRWGIRMAGLDLVGARALEVNVFSCGGLYDAERFAGVRFLPALLDALAGGGGGEGRTG